MEGDLKNQRQNNESHKARILHDPNNARKILRITADTLFLLSKDGICVDMTPNTDLWILKDANYFIGKNIFDLIPPETSIALKNNFDKVVTTGNTSTEYYKMQVGDKTFFFKCIIHDYDKDHILCQYRDIRQRISMQEQSESEVVAQAIENSTDYIFAMRTNGQLVFGNRKYKENNGWESNADITKHNLFGINRHDQNRVRWIEIIHQLTSTNQIISFVIPKPLPKKPEILAFDCTAYLAKDSKDIDLIWIFCKDITEHVQYEKQVRELNQIMGAVLTNIPMVISVKDVDNDFQYIFSNRTGDADYWGTKDSIIGKTDYEIYSRKVADEIRSDDLATVRDKCDLQKIIEANDEQGNKVIKDQLRILVRDGIRSLLIFIERDITKEKIMEQELIDAKEKAEQSDKFKSAFIANMSHEIRTPLNAILGFSKIIAETNNPEERKDYFNIVETNNNRLLRLVDEILDLSKIESGIMEFVNESMRLNPFCYDLVLKLSMYCPKGVKLIFDESDPNLAIKSDKIQLTQVFRNLIENAAKFTKEGSICFGYKKKNNHLEFYVKDTGSGIPPDQIDKVFKRFVKGNDFIQGSGLGLPICKSIIERMGGEISVHSVPDVGSCFTFTLPESCILPDKISKETGKREATILVAEDTDINYIQLENMIGKIYHLKRARNGMDAVTMFEEIKPDLILMDIRMPVMDGLNSTKVIRSLSGYVPIIAQSAYDSEDARIKAKESGCNDFLKKPFTKKQIMDIIDKYIR